MKDFLLKFFSWAGGTLLLLLLAFSNQSFAQPIHLDARAHLGAQFQSSKLAAMDVMQERRNSTFVLIFPEVSVQLSILDWAQVHTTVFRGSVFPQPRQWQGDIALLPPDKRLRPFLGLRGAWVNTTRQVDIVIDNRNDPEPKGRLWFEQTQRENRLTVVPSVRYELNDRLFLSLECGIELGHRIEEEFEIFEGSQSQLDFFLDPNKSNFSLTGAVGLATVDFPMDYPALGSFYFNLGQRITPRIALIARIF